MYNKLLTIVFWLVICIFSNTCSINLNAQQDEFKPYAVGFYNMENLFDTVDDPFVRDEEFLPDGQKAWTDEKYNHKIASMASVVSQVGKNMCQDGLSLLGVSEIENASVLQDLIAHPLLSARNYDYLHIDSKDRRGIDVALIYDKDVFEPQGVKSFFVDLSKEDEENARITRDVLLFEGYLDGEHIYITVNHWPSRSGGEKRSEYGRIRAAEVNRYILDSLQASNPNTRMIVMGDLNDNPDNSSVTKVLRAEKKMKKVNHTEMYNPMQSMYDSGFGSNAWRDRWSLFDQIIISPGLLNRNDKGLFYHKAEIFKKGFLLQKKGQYKGYPFRTFDGDVYQGGYSDHLPVCIYLLKQA